jgi:hypothetical protein
LRLVPRAIVIAVATSPGSERISPSSAVSTATSAPGADRDPDVSLGERGRDVDSVFDHRDQAAMFLQIGDGAGLVGREHVGDDLVDADFGGHALSCGAAVAGEHDRPHPELAQSSDGVF